MRNYLDLERLRQHEMMNLDFEVTGAVENQRIAPLLLIPFIENSFKHGLSNQISQGWVGIKMNIGPEQLTFTIENSKSPAHPKLTHRKSGGIGLVNVRRRLNLLYPDRYQLTIKNEPDKYTVHLMLKL